MEEEKIGTRGKSALAPPVPYLNDFFKCLSDGCDPITNPKGYISLCMAENKLVLDKLSERLQQPDILKAAFSEDMVYCYNDFLGLPSAREAIANLFTRKFLHRYGSSPSVTNDNGKNGASEEKRVTKVDPKHIAFSSGCAAVLHYACYVLAEEGDAVLIPAPFYAAFQTDVNVIAKCVPFPVHCQDPVRGPSVEELEFAAKEAEKQGLTVKMILLTNPHNPLGTIYKPHVIMDIISWARRRGNVHTIVDEIYALSVHDQKNSPFRSVLNILNNELGDDVHMLWALSKDFASSGFRVGVICSQNEMLFNAFGNLNIFSGVPHPMQGMLTQMISDDEFVDSFLQYSADRLLEAYALCTSKLKEMSIPFVAAEAGIFVYCDFSSLLPDYPNCTHEGEDRFSKLIADVAHVVMTPGRSQTDSRPGMFRLVYSWNSLEVLEIAMMRLKYMRDQILEIGWDRLDEASLSIDDIVIEN